MKGWLTPVAQARRRLGLWRWWWNVAWATLFVAGMAAAVVLAGRAAVGGRWAEAAYWMGVAVLADRWHHEHARRAGMD